MTYDETLTYEENMARGLFAIADAIRYAARTLGTGDAGTGMGALEFLAAKVGEGSGNVATALREMAEAQRDAASALHDATGGLYSIGGSLGAYDEDQPATPDEPVDPAAPSR